MDAGELLERMKEKHAVNETLSEETLANIRKARQQGPEGNIMQLIQEYF